MSAGNFPFSIFQFPISRKSSNRKLVTRNSSLIGNWQLAIGNSKAFTLVEMLVVIAIIAILAVATFASYNIPKTLEQSRYAATVEGLQNIATAAQLYANDNDEWAADVNRSIPSEFSTYISPASWAKGPFTNSVWDWDNWSDQTCWDGSTGIIQATLRQVDNYKGKNDYTIYYVIKGVGIPHCSTASTKGECINCVSRYP